MGIIGSKPGETTCWRRKCNVGNRSLAGSGCDFGRSIDDDFTSAGDENGSGSAGEWFDEFLSEESFDVAGEVGLSSVPDLPLWPGDGVFHGGAIAGAIHVIVIEDKADFGFFSGPVDSFPGFDSNSIHMVVDFPLVVDFRDGVFVGEVETGVFMFQFQPSEFGFENPAEDPGGGRSGDVVFQEAGSFAKGIPNASSNIKSQVDFFESGSDMDGDTENANIAEHHGDKADVGFVFKEIEFESFGDEGFEDRRID